jgi:Arc/MetJ-type ribon-helix-helix transcriptional regulator
MSSPELSPDTQRLIERELRLGGFSNEDEVVQAALQTLAERRSVITAIDEALDDMEAGRMQSREDFDREFRARNGIADDV